MSQRTDKVESLIRQIVAAALLDVLGEVAAYLTVTAVDVTPDLRAATVWIGDVRAEAQADLELVQASRHQFQRLVAAAMTTKFVPRLSFKLDQSGPYAEHISQLLKRG